MHTLVADIGVETAAAYRRRGYAKAAVGAVTAHTTAQGGVGFYICDTRNDASIATALSVGYRKYSRALALMASEP
jgi:RimJ/RimL family protein N-acetyltransferase